uniref:V-type proton ATPase subunit C n=1 Tax=Sphaeramia orbicularis TaxID=375764 RepID=A0A673CJT2_9TELE
MTDLWLISVPLDKTSLTNVEKLKRTIAKTNQASCCKFSIPDLKVRRGRVPSIRSLRGYEWCEQRKCVVRQRRALVFYHEMCIVKNKGSVLDLLSYVTKFQWDMGKYPTALPLSSLAELINKEVSQVETELKSRSAAYNNVKSSLQNLERKHQGTLHTRSLNEIVRKEDLVVSEYLTTLLVVVNSYIQWERTYESLSEFVVPRSSRKLYEEKEAGVFSVTLFKRAVHQFKAKAEFTVREYCFDLEEQKLQEMKQLSVHKKDQYGKFVHWLKRNFSEVFVAWIHLKALRVFVESVLRYGLPVRFQALLLQTDKKRSKKLREELASLFMHLDPSFAVSKTDVRVQIYIQFCKHSLESC